jgi:SIR2-like domain
VRRGTFDGTAEFSSQRSIVGGQSQTKIRRHFRSRSAALAPSIDEQANFFFNRGELYTVYVRTYIDRNEFSAPPNVLATADLILNGGITTAMSTNVDTLIETAGNQLFGDVVMGISTAALAALPPNRSPLLKIHGSWSEPGGTIWAPCQVDVESVRIRLEECSQWLKLRLLDRDILIVGFWTDWSYLNQVLERVLGKVTPSRVIVVDPCDTATLKSKAPALYALGGRARVEFFHVRESGDQFLDGVRANFSRGYIRRVLCAGSSAYEASTGEEVDANSIEPAETDSTILWQIRRDLEGCNPNEPCKQLEPADEPLLGLTILQLRARGAV